MQLRRYAVEIQKPRPRAKLFWTYQGALDFGKKQDGDYRNVFVWRNGRFRLLDGF